MTCVEVRSLLALRPLDLLEEDEAATVESHLMGCPACRTQARSHDEVFAMLKETPDELPGDDAPLPKEVWTKITQALDAKTAPAEVAAAPAPETIALVCALCHDVLARTDACYCASCLAPHHGECWRARGRCSAFGCEETRTVRPALESAAVRPAWSLRSVAFAAALVAGGALGAAAILPRFERPDPPAPVTPQGDPVAKERAAAEKAVAEKAARDARAREDAAKAALQAAVPRVELAPNGTLDVEAQDSDLRTLLDAIARLTGNNILVDPDVHEKVVLSLRNVPWRDTVDLIAKMTRCEVEERAAVVALTRPPHVTLQFQDANVQVVLQLLAAYSGKNIVIAPDVTGDVTVDLHDVHWLHALVAITKVHGYHVVEQGDMILVSSKPVPWGKPLDPDSFKFVPGPLASEPPPKPIPAEKLADRPPSLVPTLTLSDGRKLFLTLDGAVVDEKDPVMSRAIVSGKIYSPGAHLVDADGKDLPVLVARIAKKSVILDAAGTLVELKTER
jgi:hypothetical protein